MFALPFHENFRLPPLTPAKAPQRPLPFVPEPKLEAVLFLLPVGILYSLGLFGHSFIYIAVATDCTSTLVPPAFRRNHSDDRSSRERVFFSG